MKKLSPNTTRWISIAAVLLIAAALLIVRQQNSRQNTPLRSGSFKNYYTSAIDSLHEQTQTVRDKLHANMPGNLEILPEALLRKREAAESGKQDEPVLGDITLRGIYWSDTMPLAEINDKLCKPGDQIAGFTLKEIQPYQVLLLDATGTTQTVSLVKDL